MKKSSVFLAFIFAALSVFPGGVSASNAPIPVGTSYGEYTFASNANEDVYRNISCVTNGEHTQYGLKLTPFKTVTDSVKNSEKKIKDTTKASVKCNVTTAPEGYNDYFVEVEYLNYSNGFFSISYTDNTGKPKRTEVVCCEDPGDKTKTIFERVSAAAKITEATSETKTRIFRLENVDFSKSEDFSIDTIRTAKKSGYEYSPRSVYIKSVKVYTDDKLPIKAQVKSDRTGNIFYDRDLPEFDIDFINNIDSTVNFKVDFNVYKYNNNGEPVILPEFSKTVLENASVECGRSMRESFSVNVSDFGLYLLETDVTANGRQYTAASTEFSKCVGNDKLNDAFGVNLHVKTWDNSTLKNYMTLTRDAGFGLVRDGINWVTYEKNDGSMSLEATDKGLFKICKEYGMQPYVTIHIQNPSKCIDPNNAGLIDSTALDGAYEYVKQLMDDPNLKDVNHFEITNEPSLQVYYDEEEKKLKHSSSDPAENKKIFEAKGKAYGKICEKAIDAIREKRGKTAQIGILSACSMATNFNSSNQRVFVYEKEGVESFVNGALSYLQDPNGDGDKSDSKISEADVITYHPYSYHKNPEIINERDLTGVMDIAKKYGVNTDSAWHTEIGWSTAMFPINVACIGDEYVQAKNMVRQYASMFTRNNKDKLFIYDFIDDDIITNSQESNYGLIHSELYKTPYAAKLSYLALSNLNKMVGDLPNATFVYNTVDNLYTGDYQSETNGYGKTGNMIAKFSGDTDKIVYMLWGIEDNKEVKYAIPEDVIAYYDYLGNKITPSEVKTSNGYKVSTEPYYAVCGSHAEASIINRGENNVKVAVEGVTDKMNDTVMLFISDKDVDGVRNIDNSNLIYTSFCTSSNTGYYRFDCGMVSEGSKVYAYIVDSDGNETKTELKAQRNNAQLYLCKNMKKTDASELDINMIEDISVIADLKNDVKNNPNYKLIFALYKNGTLTHFADKGLSQSYAEEHISIPEYADYDEIRIYLWNGEKEIKPLCDKIFIK